MPIGRRIRLKPEDVDAIAKNVASVGFIKGQNSVGVWGGSAAVHRAQVQERRLQHPGRFRRHRKHQRAAHHPGRSFNALDEQERRKVAVIGQRVRDQLFAKDENPLGEDITINGITFQVIGVFESLQEGNQQQEEERIYLPNDTLRYAFNQIGSIGSFVIRAEAGAARARGRERRQGLPRADQQGESRRQGSLRQLQPAGRVRQGAGPVHRHQVYSAGWWPSAPSSRAPWAWATSC